jgi:membrane protein YqaA with SNARE-associated domain
VSGFNLAVPVPAVAFMPLFLEVGLAFWTSVLVVGLGVTAADVISFGIGRLARGFAALHAREEKILEFLTRVRERYRSAPFVILFLFAALVPFPNEALVIPFGFLGYRLSRVLLVVIAGNIVFNALYALGAVELFRAF